MFKFTVLCAVALSLSSVYAEDENAPPEDFLPLVNICLEQNGVTMAEIQMVVNKGDVSTIEPCFWGCAFTKAGFLNDQGQYDLDSGLNNLKRFMRDTEGRARLGAIAKKCESVKEKTVSDGKAGCEMGALAAACFLEQLRSERH